MNNLNLQVNLKSVGKTAFVELFDYIKNGSSVDEIKLAFKFKGWSSLSSRISTSKAIFARGEELEALDVIINSTRLDKVVRKRAVEIVSEYNGGQEEVVSEIKSTRNNILQGLCDYASTIGIEEQDIIELLLERINQVLEGDERVVFDQDGRDVKVLMDSRPTFIEVKQVNDVKCTLDLSRYIYEDNISKHFREPKKSFMRKFRSRLATQNRKYANGFTYYPTIFNKLSIEFNKILQVQLAKIYTYIKSKEGYQRLQVDELSEISFVKNVLSAKYNNQKVELFFRINDEYHHFTNYIEAFKDVSLAHTKSMYNIVSELAVELPNLLKLSEMIYDFSIADIKQKVVSDRLASDISARIDIAILKKELERIEGYVEMELMPKRINIAMGKN